MASLSNLKYTAGEARERLRPSEIGNKISNRGWMNEVQIKLAIQEAYACTACEADVLLTISVMNGFVESQPQKRGGYKYRILDMDELLASAASGVLPTTFDESAPYGDDVF